MGRNLIPDGWFVRHLTEVVSRSSDDPWINYYSSLYVYVVGGILCTYTIPYIHAEALLIVHVHDKGIVCRSTAPYDYVASRKIRS